MDARIADLRAKAGIDPEASWWRTPLDFITRRETWVSCFYTHGKVMFCHLFLCSRGLKAEGPIDRIADDNFPDIRLDVIAWLILPFYAYSAIFCAAWNFYFCTNLERRLWQAASIGIALFNSVAILLHLYATRVYFRHQTPSRASQEATKEDLGGVQGRCKRVRAWWTRRTAKLSNNSPDQDPMMHIPWKILVPSHVLAYVYLGARLYIYIQDLIGLREVPASTYTQVEWSKFLPHL